MEIILLEKSRKLGDIGDIVEVKCGYARNFLIPRQKAVRATKQNKEQFELRKKAIQDEFDKKHKEAERICEILNNKYIVVAKQAGEDGRLYGSVKSSEIVKSAKEQLSCEILRSVVDMSSQIKYLGVYKIALNFFADVVGSLNLVVARTAEEGKSMIESIKNESAKKDKEQKES